MCVCVCVCVCVSEVRVLQGHREHRWPMGNCSLSLIQILPPWVGLAGYAFHPLQEKVKPGVLGLLRRLTSSPLYG